MKKSVRPSTPLRSNTERSRSVSHQNYLIKRLRDPEEALAYLDAALMEKDDSLFLLALRNVIQAQRKMSAIARRTHLGRESMYKSISKNGNPRWKSLKKIVQTFGWRYALIKDSQSSPRPFV